MKILILLVSLFAVSVHANPLPLARTITRTGFTTPQRDGTHTLTIYDDGAVVVDFVPSNKNVPPTQKVIATISPQAAAGLKKIGSRFEDKEMILVPDRYRQPCADGPFVRYEIRNKNSTMTLIRMIKACVPHLPTLPSEAFETELPVSLLDAFQKISYLEDVSRQTN